MGQICFIKNKNPNHMEKNQLLWEKAQKRVGFRTHLFMYLISNAAFVVLWWLITQPSAQRLPDHIRMYTFWPIWPMLGWGIGLASHYFQAFVFDEKTAIDREYEKLTAQR
jgi:2TM domain